MLYQVWCFYLNLSCTVPATITNRFSQGPNPPSSQMHPSPPRIYNNSTPCPPYLRTNRPLIGPIKVFLQGPHKPSFKQSRNITQEKKEKRSTFPSEMRWRRVPPASRCQGGGHATEICLTSGKTALIQSARAPSTTTLPFGNPRSNCRGKAKRKQPCSSWKCKIKLMTGLTARKEEKKKISPKSRDGWTRWAKSGSYKKVRRKSTD